MSRVYALALIALATPARAERPLRIDHERPTLVLAVDDDDDDDDATPDRVQEAPPLEDTVRVRLAGEGRARLDAPPHVRVLWAGRPLHLPANLQLPADVRVQGTSMGEGELRLQQGARSASLPVRTMQLRFQRGDQRLDPTRDALGLVQWIPGLPAPEGFEARAFSVYVDGETSDAVEVLALEGSTRRSGVRFEAGDTSHPIYLVSDEVDASVHARTLVARLRDRIEVRVGHARQSMRVGRPGVEDGPNAVRRLRLAITMMATAGEDAVVPLLGENPEEALRIGEAQAHAVRDAWAQCFIDVSARVRLAAAPIDALLSLGGRFGRPAAGGELVLDAGGTGIHVTLSAGATPRESAERIRERAESLGLRVALHEVPAAVYAAGPSTDLVFRNADGDLLPLRIVTRSESRQSIEVGHLDLDDGLTHFTNGEPGGTLEERALITLLRDDDPRTIDLFVVDAFAGEGRNGEAFIAADGGPGADAVIIDARGASLARLAWTAAHEVGHVLLNDPFHPDNRGADTPQRLMDANQVDGTAYGPRRLTLDECRRARARSERFFRELPAPEPG